MESVKNINNTKYVLAFGNPFIKDDSLAIQIAEYYMKNPIPNIEFIKCIAPDEVMSYTDKDFYILDVVEGITEVTLIEDIDMLANEPKATAHDFDLGFFLRMMKEMDRLDKIKIIGVPKKIEKERMKEILEKVKELL